MRLRAHDYRQRRCHGHELVCCCARLHFTTTGFERAPAPFSRLWSFKLYNTLRIPTTFSIFGAFYLSIRIPLSRRLRPWQQDHLVEPLPYDLTRPFFCMKKRSFLFWCFPVPDCPVFLHPCGVSIGTASAFTPHCYPRCWKRMRAGDWRFFFFSNQTLIFFGVAWRNWEGGPWR